MYYSIHPLYCIGINRLEIHLSLVMWQRQLPWAYDERVVFQLIIYIIYNAANFTYSFFNF